MNLVKSNSTAVISKASIILLLGLILFSCSTEKNRFLNRAYHSINTKYNGYFNARESYIDALKTLSNSHVDNYEKVLSIFQYGSSQDRQAIASNMDVVYEKCSRVIRKHSMNIKGNEYNKYIDDAYYLIARSHFFKEDYNLAIIMFEYIIKQFDTPLKYESKIWIAKSYHELQQLDKANEILQNVTEDFDNGLLEKDAKRLYYLVSADHNIRQENYKKAAEFLEKGVDNAIRGERTRLTFILGQVYYRAEDYFLAQKTFARVLKMNPGFDMAFRARINMAMAYDPRSGNVNEIKAELERLLEADRYEKYRDEIYYAKAMLEIRQDNEEKAIEYLLESTKVSEDNDFQKALSYLRLGEMHFEIPKYLDASIYYDSVIAFLPRSYENFEKIEKRQRMLFDLALNIRIIEREDSLQSLASLSSAERNALVDGIISDLREQERIEREKEAERMRQLQRMGRDAARSSSRQSGDDAAWYFYNNSSISFGKSEFYTKWGDRPLEDLWRISNKQVIGFGSDFDEFTEVDTEEEAGDKYDRQTYLANIPLTSEDMKVSNEKIAQAYYNMGNIFKNRFKDYDSAIDSYNALTERYPDFGEKIYAYYYLYSLNKQENNKPAAENYRNRIINEFPESDIAKILKDPDYAENIKNRQNQANYLYQQSYNYFISGNYDYVLSNYNKTDTLDIKKPLKSKFLLLNAYTYGKKDDIELMRQTLQKILAEYSETPAYETARKLLETLSKQDLLASDESTDEKDKSDEGEISSIYKYKPDAVHFFALVINTAHIEMRDVRNIINKYNRENYPEENLTISNIFLDNKKQLITITNFKGKEPAMDYYVELSENKLFEDFDDNHYNAFLISVDNYPIFYQNKDLDEYLTFYMHYYFQ